MVYLSGQYSRSRAAKAARVRDGSRGQTQMSLAHSRTPSEWESVISVASISLRGLCAIIRGLRKGWRVAYYICLSLYIYVCI